MVLLPRPGAPASPSPKAVPTDYAATTFPDAGRAELGFRVTTMPQGADKQMRSSKWEKMKTTLIENFEIRHCSLPLENWSAPIDRPLQPLAKSYGWLSRTKSDTMEARCIHISQSIAKNIHIRRLKNEKSRTDRPNYAGIVGKKLLRLRWSRVRRMRQKLDNRGQTENDRLR